MSRGGWEGGRFVGYRCGAPAVTLLIGIRSFKNKKKNKLDFIFICSIWFCVKISSAAVLFLFFFAPTLFATKSEKKRKEKNIS